MHLKIKTAGWLLERIIDEGKLFSFWCKTDLKFKKIRAGGTLYILIENKVTHKMSDIYIAPLPSIRAVK